MKLNTQAKRLNKLAQAAGLGAHCAHCLFALRNTFHVRGSYKPDPDKIIVTCEWCGNRYQEKLPTDPLARSVALEIAHDTIADSYSTHRKRALHLWRANRDRIICPKPKAKPKPQPYGRPPQPTPAQKRRKEMLDAFVELYWSTVKRARKTAPKFPDLDELGATLQRTRFDADATSEFEREMYLESRTKQLAALSELETIIFGEPHAMTLEASEAHAAQVAEFERVKAEKEMARVAEETRRRKESAERHAAYLARTNPAQVQTPKPRADLVEASGDESDFWTRELANRQAGDAPASSVGVPFEVDSAVVPDPTRGLVLRGNDTPPVQRLPPQFRERKPGEQPYRLNGTPARRAGGGLVHVPDSE